jgi:hypothetical protein
MACEWSQVSPVLPRRFALVRHVDYTGVSGVGVVAYGVAFLDGHVILRWSTEHPSTSTWNSIDDLLAVHGHGDATTIEWIDAPQGETEELTAPRGGRRARRRAVRTDTGSVPALRDARPGRAAVSTSAPRPDSPNPVSSPASSANSAPLGTPTPASAPPPASAPRPASTPTPASAAAPPKAQTPPSAPATTSTPVDSPGRYWPDSPREPSAPSDKEDARERFTFSDDTPTSSAASETSPERGIVPASPSSSADQRGDQRRVDDRTTATGSLDIDELHAEQETKPPAVRRPDPLFTNPHKSNGHPQIDTITGLLDLPDDLYQRREPGPSEPDSSRRAGRHRRDDE